jgi:hypothetical protein
VVHIEGLIWGLGAVIGGTFDCCEVECCVKLDAKVAVLGLSGGVEDKIEAVWNCAEVEIGKEEYKDLGLSLRGGSVTCGAVLGVGLELVDGNGRYGTVLHAWVSLGGQANFGRPDTLADLKFWKYR